MARVKSKRPSTQRARRFFFQHAGWGYDPKTETPVAGRWRGARRLAEAEYVAAERGWVVTWEWDAEGFECEELGCDRTDAHEHEVLAAALTVDGETLASLGGISDPDDNYRRVIDAELFAEALATLDERDAAVAMERRHFAL